MLRSIVFAAVFYLNTAAFLLLASPLLLGPRSWAMAALRLHARVSLWWLEVIVGTRMEVRGLERLPPGPVLIAAKHQSAWDTFALVPLFRDPALVMKAELMRIPLYGWFSRKFGMIPIRREAGPSALREMLREARARAAAGREILVFPEGTRRTPGAPPDYKPGLSLLYEGLGLPCVPLALNSGLFWPRRRIERYPGTIVVEILEPIAPGLGRSEFKSAVVERIETACARLVAEAAAGPAAPPGARQLTDTKQER
ncbi:MAG: 1-acyl-sn-glycerol-3-phosphate acyltransferase [Hyphomicrobiaceae bacterium]|nr:1-acyl-sn-glycerol-3-phosphate acyltransferase [Hyphomicrobiaceae bacterium]